MPEYVLNESSTKVVLNIRGYDTDADYELPWYREYGDGDTFYDPNGPLYSDFGFGSIVIYPETKQWVIFGDQILSVAVGKIASIKTIDQAGVQIYP